MPSRADPLAHHLRRGMGPSIDHSKLSVAPEGLTLFSIFVLYGMSPFAASDLVVASSHVPAFQK